MLPRPVTLARFGPTIAPRRSRWALKRLPPVRSCRNGASPVVERAAKRRREHASSSVAISRPLQKSLAAEKARGRRQNTEGRKTKARAKEEVRSALVTTTRPTPAPGMAAPSSSLALKEYLKRYQPSTDEVKKSKKKKKKEKPKSQSTASGVIVFDNDPVWQKPVQLEDSEEEGDSAGDGLPQIEEDIEVKRMKRLETIRSLKPYHSISEDGSGWIPIPKPPRPCTTGHHTLSPPDNRHDTGDTDLSPALHKRRRRFDSPPQLDSDENTDLSPPRQRRGRLDTPSPEPKRQVDDLSPPRRRRDVDLSPPRSAKFHDQEVDAAQEIPVSALSPARKSRKKPADDLSPPRRFRGSTEAGIYPLSRTRKGSSEDLSPPRRTSCSPAVDLSPPRKATKRPLEDLSPPRRSRKRSLETTEEHNPSVLDHSATVRSQPFPKETRMGGLLSAREMREEIHMKKKDEKSRFASMDPLLSGRGAEAVHRDKEGKKISKEKLEKPKEEKKEQKPLEWGKGLAQKRDAQQRGKELELEKERPFARLRDDPELNKMLKEEIRWGDTMAPFLKRKASALILEDLGENEKMKESGFVIPQAVPSHSWLKRGLDFLPNRYGIRPGRHWDGVDRSNGYEKELYKRQNEKRANETEAYLWSVSDM